MPITFNIADHEASEIRRYNSGADHYSLDARTVVSQVWHVDGVGCKGDVILLFFSTC